MRGSSTESSLGERIQRENGAQEWDVDLRQNVRIRSLTVPSTRILERGWHSAADDFSCIFRLTEK